MQAIRRTLLGLIAFAAAAVPAMAQTAPATDSGPSLLWVWVWILVAGIIVMIVGTSIGVNSNKRWPPVFWIVMVIFVAGILVAPVIAVVTGRRTG